MKVDCPKCKTFFNLKGIQINDQGTKVRCSKCQEKFYVKPPLQNKQDPIPGTNEFEKQALAELLQEKEQKKQKKFANMKTKIVGQHQLYAEEHSDAKNPLLEIPQASLSEISELTELNTGIIQLSEIPEYNKPKINPNIPFPKKDKKSFQKHFDQDSTLIMKTDELTEPHKKSLSLFLDDISTEEDDDNLFGEEPLIKFENKNDEIQDPIIKNTKPQKWVWVLAAIFLLLSGFLLYEKFINEYSLLKKVIKLENNNYALFTTTPFYQKIINTTLPFNHCKNHHHIIDAQKNLQYTLGHCDLKGVQNFFEINTNIVNQRVYDNINLKLEKSKFSYDSEEFIKETKLIFSDRIIQQSKISLFHSTKEINYILIQKYYDEVFASENTTQLEQKLSISIP